MDEIRLTSFARTYADHVGLSLARVGALTADDGKFFARLRSGHSCTLRTANRVIQWFSDHWPEDLAWPPDIPRPAPSPDSPAARPPEPVADPLGTTLAEHELLSAAMQGTDLDAMARHTRRMWDAALTLRADGRIASVEAVCKVVNVPRTTYDYVVRRYRDDRNGGDPRPRTDAGRLLAALVESGDVRFRERHRLRAAS